jgi:hypothetical protein
MNLISGKSQSVRIAVAVIDANTFVIIHIAPGNAVRESF